MKILPVASRFLRGGHIPGAILLALLQRTPVLHNVAGSAEAALRAPLAIIFRAGALTVGALGALHSLAGATQFVVSRNPVTGTVGTAITPVAFTVTGASVPTGSFRITGSLPPGLNIPGLSGGILNGSAGTVSGTPTSASTTSISILAYQFSGATGDTFGPLTLAFSISAPVIVAPVITSQPAAVSVTIGGSATLTTAATGTPVPTFQWRKNGANIAGATSATLTLSNVQFVDAGSYSVVATNSAGSATSGDGVLTVNGIPPLFVAQPSSQTVNVGQSVTFTTIASGTPAPTFQWRRNDAEIAGATNATLNLNSVTVGSAGRYSVVASNSAGTVISSDAVLAVLVPGPVILVQPVSRVANIGQSVAFSAAAGGTPPLSYQWRKNGTNIAGATTNILALANVQPADAGVYFVVVSNGGGVVTSTSATLSVSSVPPVITMPPVSQTVIAGATANFAVNVTGAPAPGFQWRKNGIPIAGASNATLVLNNVQPADAGAYSVVVTNAAGSVTSAEAALVVTAAAIAPLIISPPESVIVELGQPVVFAVSATGTPAPALQWRLNGVDLPGATAAVLRIGSAQPADAGDYTVSASNSAGSVTSVAARLTIAPAGSAPVFTRQPVGQTAATGSTVVFSVEASGAANYQWRRDGLTIAGATGASLVVTAIGASAGAYFCVATSASGAAAASAPATLAVIATPEFGRLINLSIGTNVTADAPSFVVGTVIGGAGTSGVSSLLVRAAGPALSAFGVGGALADPRLAVFAGATGISSNDDWGGGATLADVFARLGAFAFEPGSKDAAVFSSTLPVGGYTVQVSGAADATGAVLAELYDATTASTFGPTTPRLINVSVLKQIGAGTTLTAGFVIAGRTARTVLVRAIGPGLAAFAVPGTVPDPRLVLFNGAQAAIAQNDNWGGDTLLVVASSTVGAFGIADVASKDAMLLITLAPGNYTAQVSSSAGGGTALVEVYEVP